MGVRLNGFRCLVHGHKAAISPADADQSNAEAEEREYPQDPCKRCSVDQEDLERYRRQQQQPADAEQFAATLDAYDQPDDRQRQQPCRLKIILAGLD